MKIDVLEQGQLDQIKMDLTEKLDHLHQSFTSKVKPEQGVYGVTEMLKDDGTLVKTGKNELGHSFKEYYRDGCIFKKREALGKGQNLTTEYDSIGQPYAQTWRTYYNNGVKDVHTKLWPNTTVVKDNFTAVLDSQGRPISNKVTDLKICDTRRKNISIFKNESYGLRDQLGHVIAHIFGGPDSPENIVAQLDEVNLGKMKRVENIVKDLKNEGHTVDYEVRCKYDTITSKRPSSFEPIITVDGELYTELPKELQKIFNKSESELTTINKAIIATKERIGPAHEVGLKSGMLAAGMTLAISSVENISAFANGEISGEEMATEITKDTVSAGALGYGSAFITTAASQAMRGASSEMIQRIGGSCLPAATVSFAIDSYESISEFAQGKMDISELAYDLGDSAASVAGSFAGGALAGGAAGTIAGPVGAVAGSIVGGVVGCALASEAYATAVELGSEGAEIVAEHAQRIAHETSEYVRENIPEKFDEVKTAFTDFFEKNHLPCNNLRQVTDI